MNGNGKGSSGVALEWALSVPIPFGLFQQLPPFFPMVSVERGTAVP